MQLTLHHQAAPANTGLEAALPQLRAALGDSAVSTRGAERLAYGRDLWPLTTLELRDGAPPAARPEVVVRPREAAQVQRVVDICHAHQLPLIPVGGGSGVCGGTVATRGGVALDLKRLDRLLDVDERALTIEVEPGLMGLNLEEMLNARGLTLGHFPSSIACSTVGGYLAARSAGQLSSRYGKMEDMVLGLQVATPGLGLIGTGCYAPSCAGPDWTQAIVGSEGTLGVVVRARLKVHRAPTTRLFRGYHFRTVEDGMRAFRECLQAGLRPSVLRLYDPADHLLNKLFSSEGEKPAEGDPAAPHETHQQTPEEQRPVRRLGPFVVTPGTLGDRLFRGVARGARSLDPRQRLKARLKEATRVRNLPLDRLLARPGMINRLAELAARGCEAILGCEGEDPRVQREFDACRAIFERCGGRDEGPEPGERWFKRRYHISYKLPSLLGAGAMSDTLEFAATWDRVPALYSQVRSALTDDVLLLAHFSHAYPEGCSIYFTAVASAPDLDVARPRYRRLWERALRAAAHAGATVSHHHGIGLLKREAAAEEQGPALALYWALKDTIDPAGILNPDKLFPPRTTGAA